MNLFEEPRGFLFLMLYAGVAMAAILAGIYLLFRKANAIAPEINPPTHLRQWAAIFVFCLGLSHYWWIPYYIGYDVFLSRSVATLLDTCSISLTMLYMLDASMQDRKRSKWPYMLVFIPHVLIIGWGIVNHDETYLQIIQILMPATIVGYFIYMVYAVRRYMRWLQDNYADLENKEVWPNNLLIFLILIMMSVYNSSEDTMTIQYIIQLDELAMLATLLWYVETLQAIEPTNMLQAEIAETEHIGNSLNIPANIGQLLKEHCEDRQLYLQQDISLTQMAESIGTNRYYLSQYFSRNNTTYNAYTNSLRVQHFIKLYHNAIENGQPFTAQQLAYESGYRSYRTFSDVFRRIMNQSATDWMRKQNK